MMLKLLTALLAAVAWLEAKSLTQKEKDDPTSSSAPAGSPVPTPSEVIGVNKPAGPLSQSFQNSHRFPGFPFEFPPIIPGSSKKYLIFPSDSAANYLASAKRCGAMGGKMVKLETPVEMEILACAITSPVFVASWLGNDFGGPLNGACPVLYPGGVIASMALGVR